MIQYKGILVAEKTFYAEKIFFYGDNMNTNRDLNYRLYIQKTDGFTRTPFNTEFEHYIIVKSGNVEKVKNDFASVKKNFFAGKGKLSDDPIRNTMYHFVVAAAVVARVCVEGGLGHDTAYTLSDIYIQKADKCKSVDAIIDILEEMMIDFAERMHELKKDNVVSIHIRKCIDYIYAHLYEELSIKRLSEVIGLNASYLSKLFVKEKGISINEFITRAKISTAENLLKFSDFTSLEISMALGYSSQSAFISVFKKINGVTPKQYRDSQYMSNITNPE